MDEEKEEDMLESGRGRQGLLVWGGLLLVPVVMSLFFSLTQRPPSPPAPQAAQEAAPARTQAAPQVLPDGRQRGSRRRAAQRPAESCGDTKGWAGIKITPEMETRLKGLGRAYRALPPGSVMSMDNDPARVNFDLDENGTVIRAWCG